MCTHFVFSQWEEMRAAIKVFSHQVQNKTACNGYQQANRHISLHILVYCLSLSQKICSAENRLTVATYPKERVLPETPQTAISLFVHSMIM